MELRRTRARCTCSTKTLLLTTPLLFLSLILPSSSYAQLLTDSTSSTSEGFPIPTISNTLSPSAPETTSITTSPSSLITSFVSSRPSNATTSTSSSSTSTGDPQNPFFPNSHPPGSGDDHHVKEGVFNYYFLFLALFGVLIGVSLWLLHRQKKRRKERDRLSAQNALARDLDGWSNTRRWMHGSWRHNRSATLVRREEGLDENGEAPPPYEPKQTIGVTDTSAGPTQDPATGLTIPPPTLSRGDIEVMQPPGYQEIAMVASRTRDRPGLAEFTTTRPDTAYTHQNDSVRDLLQSSRAVQ